MEINVFVVIKKIKRQVTIKSYVSLLVSNKLDEVIPVAYCIFNKKTFQFLEIFFKEKAVVKSNCGFTAPR